MISVEASWLTDAASYSYLRTTEITVDSLAEKAIENTYNRQGRYHRAPILGARNGTITLKGQLHGYTSTLVTNTPDADSSLSSMPLYRLFASAFGNATAGVGYSTGESGSDINTLKGASIGADGFLTGHAIGWNTPYDGYQVGWSTNVDTVSSPDEIPLLQTAVAVPAGGILYGSGTCFSSSGADAYHVASTNEGFSVKILGDDAKLNYRALGCKATGLRISMPHDEVPTWEVDLMVGNWGFPGSGAAPAVQAWTYPEPEAFKGVWISKGSSAVTTRRLQSLEFDLGVEAVALPDSKYSVGGIGAILPLIRKPTLTYVSDWDYDEEITDFQSGTEEPVVVTFGSQPGMMASLCIPNACVVELPHVADAEGVATMPVTVVGNYYDSDTGTTGGYDTACRFAWV